MMSRHFACTVSLVALLAATPLAVSAAPAAAAAVTEQNPQVVIQSAIDSMTARLNKDRKQLQKNPAALTQLIEQNITPFVDITGIARGVMGQYYRQATPEQRERFVTTFKQSMVRSYSNGMAAYNNQKVVVKPYQPGDDPTKAQISVEVSLDNGTMVPVIFQMVKDPQGAWKTRNLIVNGLNLGLTFRKRFADVVEQSGGNLDKAIAIWSPGQVEAIASKDKP